MPFLDAVVRLVADHKAAVFVVGPILATLAYVVYQLFLSPLAKVPGPPWAKVSRLWITKHSWDGDMHRTVIELHNRHGNLVRTGPNEVSVANLNAIKKIYEWYSVWQGRRKFDLFAGRNEAIHGQHRRLVARAYSMDALKDLEQYVDESIKVFMENMSERVGKVIDVGNWVQLFAFDIIGEITFSKRFGFMDVGADDGSFQAIETALRSAAWLGQVPWIFWLHDYLQPFIGNYLGITARNGSLRQFALRETEARKDRGTDRKDILSKLLAVHKERPTEFDYSDLVSMASSNIFAGSDTTAISTRAIIYYLLKNPEYKQKLVEEIDEFRSQGKLSDPVTLDEANNMPYLQAVMYEALRCHPAVGMSLPRIVPPGGTEIDGTYLPAGTIVGVNPWVVHRNKEVYGNDVEAFRPDRWLKEDNGDMHRFFFAFGSGARTCIGRNISWMEMSKLIPTLFMHYDLQLVDPEALWTETCWWFVMQQGIKVVLRPRY
ncbi:cytochrome p450 family protein [Neofusicoccum parvum]|uniref:Putative cytochrome p450 family protein n=1 Tax=Botryosphaeria parva (strain UCR-NP2) TaxID=1287680 RepID=R1EWE9_BOTPV|nr:putative cytochrome p450 family protein [Neofusicoccum parvum UCRNP2]GME51343.1 cytochrome p450 family protein [Neofusicoccum parvum]